MSCAPGRALHQEKIGGGGRHRFHSAYSHLTVTIPQVRAIIWHSTTKSQPIRAENRNYGDREARLLFKKNLYSTAFGLFLFLFKLIMHSCLPHPHTSCINPALCDPWKRFDPSEQDLTGWLTTALLISVRKSDIKIGQIPEWTREQLEYRRQDDTK